MTLGLERAIRTAFRTRLLSLPSVAMTGPLSIQVTSLGFVRSDGGSFVNDGWTVGSEVVGSGFTSPANGLPRLVVDVSDTTLIVGKIATATVITPANPGVTLRAGLPQGRAWESRGFTPPSALPWLRESLIPAGSEPLTIGPHKRIQNRGIYQISLFYPTDYGTTAQDDMAAAVRSWFFPGLTLTAGGYFVNIRSSSRAQALPEGGNAHIPISIAYEVHTVTPE